MFRTNRRKRGYIVTTFMLPLYTMFPRISMGSVGFKPSLALAALLCPLLELKRPHSISVF